jgi:hypothetical protein
MNSILTLNWQDKEIAHRIGVMLEQSGYTLTENYDTNGQCVQVWKKEPERTFTGRGIDQTLQESLRRMPAQLLANMIQGRLAVCMPEGTPEHDVAHAALMLVYDLQGLPG